MYTTKYNVLVLLPKEFYEEDAVIDCIHSQVSYANVEVRHFGDEKCLFIENLPEVGMEAVIDSLKYSPYRGLRVEHSSYSVPTCEGCGSDLQIKQVAAGEYIAMCPVCDKHRPAPSPSMKAAVRAYDDRVQAYYDLRDDRREYDYVSDDSDEDEEDE